MIPLSYSGSHTTFGLFINITQNILEIKQSMNNVKSFLSTESSTES